MITNIFSVFDPSSIFLPNWVRLRVVLFIIPTSLWTFSNKLLLPWNLIFKKLNAEFFLLLTPSSPVGVTPLIISLFVFIMLTNLLGLTSYTFTATSHIRVTLAISLPIWAGLMLYGWLNSPSHMLAHLIPQRTPPVLIPFIVLIETTSNVIRSATLAIRLTANIMAGHLLITLLGNQVASNERLVITPVIVSIPIILLTLEIAVATIQAYVFSVLITLYSGEVSYDN